MTGGLLTPCFFGCLIKQSTNQNSSTTSDALKRFHHDYDARWADVEELLDTADIDMARPAW